MRVRSATRVRDLTLECSQPDDRITRSEGSIKKSTAVEELKPLAIPEVRLGTTRHISKLSSVDENNLQPLGFEQLIDRDPVHRSALHGHRLQTPRSRSHSASSLSRLVVVPKTRRQVSCPLSRDHTPMLSATYIETRNHRLYDREGCRRGCTLLLVLLSAHLYITSREWLRPEMASVRGLSPGECSRGTNGVKPHQ